MTKLEKKHLIPGLLLKRKSAKFIKKEYVLLLRESNDKCFYVFRMVVDFEGILHTFKHSLASYILIDNYDLAC